jgi:TonB family protein
MNRIRHVHVVTSALVLVLSVGLRPAAAQDSLAAAKELYAGASYEDALSMLTRLKDSGGLTAADARSVDQFRAFCLLALGRQAEAERAIEDVVSADITYQPGESEVAPRVRSTFHTVRQRVLPGLVQQKYAMAKATFDRKEYAAAIDQFTRVIALLDDPDVEAARKDPAFADLKTLAAGFLDLARSALAPPPPPKPEPAPAPAAPPVPRIYGGDDTSVTQPVVIRQDIPPWPRLPVPPVVPKIKGLLEIVIGENGEVESAVLRRPMNKVFDESLLNAARRWKYQPATKDGKPVKFRKLIEISVDVK